MLTLPCTELTPAYTWTCVACGANCLTPALRVDRDFLERASVHEIMDPILAGGPSFIPPPQVSCPHCGVEQDASLVESVTSAGAAGPAGK
jgi:hypothetical protein